MTVQPKLRLQPPPRILLMPPLHSSSSNSSSHYPVLKLHFLDAPIANEDSVKEVAEDPLLKG